MKFNSFSQLDQSRIVQVREEFGFRDWLWAPDFPLEDLQVWWEGQQKLGFIQVEQFLSERGQCWCVEECDQPYEAARAIWDQYGTGYYHLHLCCDTDSWLYTLEDKKVVHAGYSGRDAWKDTPGYIG